MSRFVLLGLACVAVLFAGCKPKAGASCKAESKEVCVGDKQAMGCHDGKWEEMTCNGPTGCVKSGSEGTCDQSVAEEKDVCTLEGDITCTGDKKGMLECQKNHWALVQTCFGDGACSIDQKKVHCDNSLATAGDPCREDKDFACSTDKKSALVCNGKSFVVSTNCRGKNGCRLAGDRQTGLKVDCDDTLAAVGDPCAKENHYACAPDERAILKCVSGKFIAEDKCKQPKEKCAVRGEMVGCY